MWTSSAQVSRNGGSDLGGEASLHAIQVGVAPGETSTAERHHAAVDGQLGLPSRPDRRHDTAHLRRERAPDPVAGGVAVRDRGLVPEPVVERRQVSRARLEEQAFRPGVGPLHGGPEGVREVGVPPEGLAADAGAVAREPHDDRHHAVLAVHAEHGHGIVDRPARVDAVDGDARGPPDSRADRRRLPAGVRPVDGPGEAVRQRGRVPVEPLGAHGRPHAVRLEQHGRAVVVGGVQEHGLGGDAGQRRDPAPRGLGNVPRHPQEIGGDERDSTAAVVEHERLRDERLVDPVGAPGPEPPGAGLDAEGRSDVHAADAGTKTTHARAPLGAGQRAGSR